MSDELKELIRISGYYGSDKDFVIAGGGNTSFKNDRYIWVKASGFSMATIEEEGFVQLHRDKVKVIGRKQYNKDDYQREIEVKNDLMAARVFPETGARPSVETAFHELIEYPYVVHTHPTLVNALMCSQYAEEKTRELFGEEVLFVSYAAGYRLFKKVSKVLTFYRDQYRKDPQLIFLQNHGIFVGATSVEEIKSLYNRVIRILRNEIHEEPVTDLPLKPDTEILTEGIKSLVSGRSDTVRIRHNTLHQYFYGSADKFRLISRPFTPDIIVYCGTGYLYSDKDASGTILADLQRQWAGLKKVHKQPKIILVKNYGLVTVEENIKSAETALDIFEDFMKISKYSATFGGPHPMPGDEIDFINQWEVENYRRKISKSKPLG